MSSVAVAVPGSKGPVLKSHSTMARPYRDSRLNGPRVRSKEGQPFDPADLTRRLNLYLDEQKILAERRRVIRAIAAGEHVAYHHTPKMAAADFEITATPDKMRSVHKLAQPALKNLDMLRIDELIYGKPVTILQRSQAMDRAVADRNSLRNRNQYHWTDALQRAAELDAERQIYKCPQRTFRTDRQVHRTSLVSRPMSMGHVAWEREDEHAGNRKRAGNDRHNWSQSDEVNVRRSTKDRISPLLALKSKIGRQEGTGGMLSNIHAPREGGSSKRASFFARFSFSRS